MTRRASHKATQKDAKKFDLFTRHLRWREKYIHQYRHNGPRDDWEEWEDLELKRCSELIRPCLRPLARLKAFVLPEGLPHFEPILAQSAHEALFQIHRFPRQLIGYLSVLDGKGYKAIRLLAAREYEQIFPGENVRTEGTVKIRGAFDDGQRLVLKCIRKDRQIHSHFIPTPRKRELLLLLDSREYRELTSEWDEYIWDQIWGSTGAMGRSPSHTFGAKSGTVGTTACRSASRSW